MAVDPTTTGPPLPEDPLETLTQIGSGVAETRSLTLDASRVGAETGDSLSRIFRAATVRLSGCSVTAPHPELLVFHGTLTDVLFPGEVTVDGCLMDLPRNGGRRERHCILALDIPESVNAVQLLKPYSGFPDSVDSFLTGKVEPEGSAPLIRRVSLADRHLLFSSLDFGSPDYKSVEFPAELPGFRPSERPAEPVRRGLQFRVTLEFADDLSAVFQVLSLRPPFSFTAVIVSKDQQLNLYLSQGFPGHSGFSLASFTFTLSEIRLEFTLATLGEAYPSASLHGAISIGELSEEFEADYDLTSQRLSVSVAQNTKLPGLDQFARLVGKQDLAHAYLPPNSNSDGYGTFTLESLSLTVELTPVYFREVSFRLSTEKPVALLHDIISVTPTLAVRVDSPFDASNRREDVLLSGQWLLRGASADSPDSGGTLFNTYLSLTEQTLEAEMAVGESLDLSAVLNKILPGVKLPSDSLQLLDLELSADWGRKSFEVEIDIATDWEFTVAGASFAMNDLRIEAEYAEKAVQTCTLSGRITLAGLDLDALAAYNGSQWTLRAATFPNETITFSGIFDRLRNSWSGQSGSLVHVPVEFLNASISDLFLEYKTGSGSMTFYCSLNHVLKFTDKFSVDRVFVQIHTDSQLTGMGRAKLTLAGADVFLSCSKQGEGWSFNGSTGEGQAIPIGTLMKEVGHKFDVERDIPAVFDDLTIKNLTVSYETTSRNFEAGCIADFKVGSQAVELTVSAALAPSTDSNASVPTYQRVLGGDVKIGTRHFNLHYQSDYQASQFLASYGHPEKIGLSDLLRPISTSLAEQAPSGLSIQLKEAVFAYSKDPSGKYLLRIDLGASASLSDLPIVGGLFPAGHHVSVDDLQILAVSEKFDHETLVSLNEAMPTGSLKFPSAGLSGGVHLSARLNLGDSEDSKDTKGTLTLSFADDSAPPQVKDLPKNSGSDKSQGTATPSSRVRWFNIQKAFGPVRFERIGIQFENSVLSFPIDASVTVSGLTIELEGLSAGSRLDQFSPVFSLRGLGIDYTGGEVEIGGTFVRDTVQAGAYHGAAVIKTEKLTVAAIGSYAELNGHPSLFVFGFLDQPIGGPAFFFVTGLAAGFGFNRTVVIPSLDDLPAFPLVNDAVHGVTNPGGSPGRLERLQAKLLQLQDYIPPSPGEAFLAIGVKFTSFKMIDSVALLTATFGHRFELHVLGLSTLLVPPRVENSVSPLAELQMALIATFSPEDGVLAVAGQLTPASYIFSRECRLTGGFAFYAWFKTGDFVQTIGGYHPAFQTPAHYPKVPRLAFNWQVTGNLNLKGDAYYALTPAALMAGGHLQATWSSGPIDAWFNAGADFLISWKPYHYDAELYVDVGVSFTFHFFGTHHISADVGADLHIWGPDFSGDARVHLWIVSFTVSFGDSSSDLHPISWDEFRKSFLPDDQAVCGIAVQQGLVSKLDSTTGQESKDLGIINPSELLLTINSVIPLNQKVKDGASIPLPELVQAGPVPNKDFGIAPMAQDAQSFYSALGVKVSRGAQDVTGEFKFTPILKNVPAALWGHSLAPDLDGAPFIKDALCGFEVAPAKEPDPGQTRAIDRGKLRYEPKDEPNAYSWNRVARFKEETQQAKKTLTVASTQERADLLEALGMSSHVSIDNAIDFVVAPQSGQWIPHVY